MKKELFKKVMISMMTVLMLLCILSGCRNTSNQQNSSGKNEVQILEDEGEIEIEIPEDQESGGF
ncbi:MAG: hypothetical protein IJI66_14385 [Erysipelotrichaceae bacterium]|nr:hypothetical protein [Clostridia bacterium]MBQ6217781.1 hypothetical protein [Erysipelotrichaceae bacterium]MBR0420346.1 hypothetical protein [Erysipelotrichaceae bacterium]